MDVDVNITCSTLFNERRNSSSRSHIVGELSRCTFYSCKRGKPSSVFVGNVDVPLTVADLVNIESGNQFWSERTFSDENTLCRLIFGTTLASSPVPKSPIRRASYKINSYQTSWIEKGYGL